MESIEENKGIKMEEFKSEIKKPPALSKEMYIEQHDALRLHLAKIQKRFELESHNHKIHEKFYNKINVILGYPATILVAVATFIGGLQARNASTFDSFSLAILIMNGLATIISVSNAFWKTGDKRDLHANASSHYSDMAKKLKAFLYKDDLSNDDLQDQETIILELELVVDKYKPNFGALGCIKPATSLD